MGNDTVSFGSQGTKVEGLSGIAYTYFGVFFRADKLAKRGWLNGLH